MSYSIRYVVNERFMNRILSLLMLSKPSILALGRSVCDHTH
jgi:hypothetical protein